MNKLNIVIATQGYRFNWFSKRVLPTLLKSLEKVYNYVESIYIVPNNLEGLSIADYEREFSNIQKVKIIEGNDEYKYLNKFIPYYTTVGHDLATIHIDDDLIINEDIILPYFRTAALFPSLVIGSGKCQFYQISHDKSRINKSVRLAPLVSDCITNMVWLNNGLIYLPAGCLKNSFILDFDLMKSDKFNKLVDEEALQLHLLVNNFKSYILNNTLNVGTDQIPYVKEMIEMCGEPKTRGNYNDSVSQFINLINSEEYRDIIVKNFVSNDFIVMMNDSNAMAIYLLKEKLADIFNKVHINITTRPDEHLNISWIDLLHHNHIVEF